MTDLASQVKVLRKELGVLTGQSTKFKTRVVKAEEEILFLKQKHPNRLEVCVNEVVENFQQNEVFTMRRRYGVGTPWSEPL